MANTTQRMLITGSVMPVESESPAVLLIEARYNIMQHGTLAKASLEPGHTFPEDSTYFINSAGVTAGRAGTRIATVRSMKYRPWS